MRKLNRWKRTAGVLTAAGLLILGTLTVFAAPRRDGEEKGLQISGSGYIGSRVPRSLHDGKTTYLRRREAAEPLPARYDLRTEGRVSTVKDQNPFNTCWAFSALDSAQSGMLTVNTPVTGGEQALPDLSERHLSYFTFGGNGEDRFVLPGGISGFDMGGNPYMAAAALSKWHGAVDEDKAPYISVGGAMDLPESMRKQSDYHLKNMWFLPNTARFADDYPESGTDNGYYLDPDAVKTVKRAIKSFGAVGVSFYSGSFSDSYYYASEAYAHYVYDYEAADHEVTIVGWDDSYSKDKFAHTPPEDGAWIVKNTWGQDFGDGGYFYISYFDRSLCEFTVYQMEKAGTGSHACSDIYQYDGAGSGVFAAFQAENGKHSFANVFKAREGGILREVSAYSMEQGTSAAVQVYVNPSGGKPDSGTKKADFTATLQYAGYHTIELPEDIMLKEGDTFSVVETIVTQDGRYELPVEVGYEPYYDYGIFSIEAGIEKGKSYVNKGQSWLDLKEHPFTDYDDWGEYYSGNAMIKAFADQLPVLECIEITSKDSAGKELETKEYRAKDGLSGLVLPAGTAQIVIHAEASGGAAVQFTETGAAQGAYTREQFERGLHLTLKKGDWTGGVTELTFRVPELVISGQGVSFTDPGSRVPTGAALTCTEITSGQIYDEGMELLQRLTSSGGKMYETALMYNGTEYETSSDGILEFQVPGGMDKKKICLFEVRQEGGRTSLVLNTGSSAFSRGGRAVYLLAEYVPDDMPQLSEQVYNPDMTLKDIPLPEGWQWSDSGIVPDCATGSYEAFKTLTDEGVSGKYSVKLPLMVKQAVPQITGAPEGQQLTYGSRLKDSALTGGQALCPGKFRWKDETVRPRAGRQKYPVRFIPEDSVNYQISETKAELVTLPRKVTVEILDAEKTYQQNNPSFDFYVDESRLAAGDNKHTLGVELFSEAGKNSAPGKYPIVPVSEKLNPDYEITFLKGTLTIIPPLKKETAGDRPVPKENIKVKSAATKDQVNTGAGVYLSLCLLALAAASAIREVRQKHK